ncbi:hypothetical protein KKC59_04635 [bacterium]|nr:hypothetical protein [bacterium]
MREKININIMQIIGAVVLIFLSITGFFLTSFFSETKGLEKELVNTNVKVEVNKTNISTLTDTINKFVIQQNSRDDRQENHIKELVGGLVEQQREFYKELLKNKGN